MTAKVTTRKTHRMTTEDIQYLISAYTSGDSIRAIAEHIGCSYGSVHRWLALSKVPVRPRGGVPREGHLWRQP